MTNHDLVKYFKAWLTHPTEKESARQKFKEYVNTLATIKQENGEKYLMLKKRYYPNFDDEQEDPKGPGSGYAAKSSSPSLLDEVMAGYHSLSTAPTGAVYGNQQSQQHQLPRLGLENWKCACIILNNLLTSRLVLSSVGVSSRPHRLLCPSPITVPSLTLPQWPPLTLTRSLDFPE